MIEDICLAIIILGKSTFAGRGVKIMPDTYINREGSSQ